VAHGPQDLLSDRSLAPELAELGRLIPALRGEDLDPPTGPAHDSDGDRYRLFEAVTTLLMRAMLSGPLLVVLDDLHWARQADAAAAAPRPARDRALPAAVRRDVYRDVELGLSARALGAASPDCAASTCWPRSPSAGSSRDEVAALVSARTGPHLLASRHPAARPDQRRQTRS